MMLTILGPGEGQLFRQTTWACHNSEASVAQSAAQPFSSVIVTVVGYLGGTHTEEWGADLIHLEGER